MVPPMLWVQRGHKARFAQGQYPGEVVEVRIRREVV
jgi:hypothetical protein